MVRYYYKEMIRKIITNSIKYSNKKNPSIKIKKEKNKTNNIKRVSNINIDNMDCQYLYAKRRRR